MFGQSFEQETAALYASELDWIEGQQQEFDKAIGRIGKPADWLHLSYNPVSQRLHFEKLYQRSDWDGLEKYRQEVRSNIVTNLMERFRVCESAGTFTIKDGQLYSGYFPSEPFSNVLLRGALYRQRMGSEETMREGWPGELGGWQKINNLITSNSLKSGEKVVSFSPPGLVRESAYTARFVDIFEPIVEKGERKVSRKRIAVGWEPDQYEQEALKLDKDYFKNKDERPSDAWYLSHPTTAPKNYSPEKSMKTMPKEKFEVIEQECEPLTQAFLNLIFAPKINWKQVAKAFNAIVNKADLVAQELGNYVDRLAPEQGKILQSLVYMPIWQQIDLLGGRQVVEVDGFGCPINRGFNVSSILSSQPFGLNVPYILPFPGISNSVAKFSSSGEDEWKYHSCVNCEKTKGDFKIKWVGSCNICKECEKVL